MKSKLFRTSIGTDLTKIPQPVDSHVIGPSDPAKPPKMTEADRLKLGEMTRGMSEEEIAEVKWESIDSIDSRYGDKQKLLGIIERLKNAKN